MRINVFQVDAGIAPEDPSFQETCKKAGSTCVIHWPVSNMQLTSLIHPDHYTITNSLNTTLIFNICKPLGSTVCPGNGELGACVIRTENVGIKGMPAGKFSRDIVRDHGTFIVTYDRSLDGNLSTVIRFICDQFEDGHGKSILHYESDLLEFQVLWYSSHFCLRENVGIIKMENVTYSLRPLIKSRGMYSVDTMKDRASISVNPFQVLPYTQDSPVGSLANLWSSTMTGGISLGRSVKSFKVVGNGKLQLVYSDGDSCLGCPGNHFSTRIMFYCSQNEVGSYMLISNIGYIRYRNST